MPQLRVQAGRKYLVMNDERRADLDDLALRLSAGGNDTELQIIEYEPGRRGVAFNQPEAVAIYIAGGVSGALITNMTTDIYNKTKSWAKARFEKKVAAKPNGLHKPETFTIYGPDNQILRSWRIDENGEHEEDAVS
jgi:hypothetical protein